MRHFVLVADRERLETYLQSHLVALKIYRRFGWENVNNFDTDLTKWDAHEDHGIHRVVCMLRSPVMSR